MRKLKRRLLFAAAVAIAAVAAITYVGHQRPNEGQTPGHSSNAFADYGEPSGINLSLANTYTGSVDVTGTWVNVRDVTDTFELKSDGRYMATAVLSLSGEYEIRKGYVAFVSDAGAFHALRMVETDSVDILLQQDDEILPYTYRRVLPDEALEEPSKTHEEEDVIRHYVSSFVQIFCKSRWIPLTKGVEKINIDAGCITLSDSQKVAAKWTYLLDVPQDISEISYELPYQFSGTVDGEPYIFELNSAPYSEGYSLRIFNDSGPLLEAKCIESVEVEEP